MSVTGRHVRMTGAVEAFFAGYGREKHLRNTTGKLSFIVGVPGFEPGTSNSREAGALGTGLR